MANGSQSVGLYEKSWSGQYFGRHGAIALARMRFKEEKAFGAREDMIGALSALSSTYYSAAGHAYARFKNTRMPWWAFRAGWCLRRALAYSDQAIHLAPGTGRLTVDQLDVRQSILRKVAEKKRDRYRSAYPYVLAALDCINAALRREGVSRHARGLLLVGKIDILTRYPGMRWGDDDVEAMLHEALEIADHVASGNPRQAIRIYRGCMMGFECLDDAEQAASAREKARALAESTGAHDQLLKLGAN
jgi:hypothetical protein